MVLASVYALRMFIRAMHNRVGPRVSSRELGLLDAAVLAPLVAVIVFLAVYPQFALHRSERSVKSAVAAAAVLTASNSPRAARPLASLPRGCKAMAAKYGSSVLGCIELHSARK